MRPVWAYVGATALSLAMLLAAAPPSAAEVSEAQRCVGEEAAATDVLEANMTPRPEQGPEGRHEPVITQGTPLVLTGPSRSPVTFTVAAQLPPGYELRPLEGKYYSFGPTPELPAELAGGAATEGPEWANHFQLYTFTTLVATTIPRTIYYQASFQYGPTAECPNSHFTDVTEIQAVIVVAAPPAASPQEQKPTPMGGPPMRVCVVPALKHHSLKAATTELLHDHCKLGRVTRPHNQHQARVVVHQSRKAGTRLPVNTKIAVTLGH